MKSRNAYMLSGAVNQRAYDWWWHSFVAEHAITGEKKPFFVEYYVVNPGLSPDKIIFGLDKQAPSYAMIKAGSWGKDKAQIHNFWPCKDFHASTQTMDLTLGPHSASEYHLRGSVSVSESEAAEHPEYLSDAGTMSWDLQAKKELVYSVGYGASAPFRALSAFQMFWHVGGMKTSYSGELTYKGQPYVVRSETCAGYQDKNWGSDYTSPWVWLNCNNFVDEDGQVVTEASLDVGGGLPRLFGLPLGEKVLAAFYFKGKLYEFNFSHFWAQEQKWKCSETETDVHWNLELKNLHWRLTLDFSCPKEFMIFAHYENTEGFRRHKRLWNGGNAQGVLGLYKKNASKDEKPWLTLFGSYGGCEYGRI